ncbi:hypothetical protein WDW37_19725 [Bdellovibrionota bacterium FG-1]
MSFFLASTTNAANPNFVIHQNLPLSKELDGFDGRLEILRDSRLRGADIKMMKEHDPDSNPERAPRFKTHPLRMAVVQLKSGSANVVQSITLDKPYANLEAVTIGEKGRRYYFLTQDFAIGMGSYNGPITQILEVTSQAITWAKARDLATHKESPISLMRSLKTAWNFASSKNGKDKDILEVSCRPADSKDASKEGFITTFSRYHHSSQGWTLVEKSENGFWEAEDGDQRLGYALPDLRKFPGPIGNK